MRRAQYSIAGIIATFMISSGVAWADTYNMTVGPSPLPSYGRGQVQGTLQFQGPKTFSYDTYLYDICPGDGLGVSFYFNVVRPDGYGFVTESKGRTTHLCNQGFNNYSGTVWSTPNVTQKARVVMCWARDAEPCWAVPIDGIGSWKWNPYR